MIIEPTPPSDPPHDTAADERRRDERAGERRKSDFLRIIRSDGRTAGAVTARLVVGVAPPIVRPTKHVPRTLAKPPETCSQKPSPQLKRPDPSSVLSSGETGVARSTQESPASSAPSIFTTSEQSASPIGFQALDAIVANTPIQQSLRREAKKPAAKDTAPTNAPPLTSVDGELAAALGPTGRLATHPSPTEQSSVRFRDLPEAIRGIVEFAEIGRNAGGLVEFSIGLVSGAFSRLQLQVVSLGQRRVSIRCRGGNGRRDYLGNTVSSLVKALREKNIDVVDVDLV